MVRRHASCLFSKWKVFIVLNQSFFVICRNFELKMKCKELEIMQLSYSPDANKALSKIGHDFNEKISESEKHQAQLRGELEHYQSLGKSFDDIAEKYSKVLQEIQHIEWMLNSMHQCDEKEKKSTDK